MSEWTSTPWYVDESLTGDEPREADIFARDSDVVICATPGAAFPNSYNAWPANAARIVTCVNGFDALVEALTEAVASFEQLVKLNRIPENMKGLRVAREALAKVLPPSTSNPEGK